jgi:2-haloacid dehalogenase
MSGKKTSPSDLPCIVFDCNETLLDLGTMTPIFERLFGDRSAMRLWFQALITYSQALTITGHYEPFTDIGGAVLQMMADARRVPLTAGDRQELTDKFATMPPYPDVPTGLRALKNAGFRLFTLTDNTAEISGRQLRSGGILEYFERRFSVDDESHRHKPAPQAYEAVSRALPIPASRRWLVACHTWDTMGAAAVGWESALIRRVDNDVLDVAPQPQIVGQDLNDVANQLVSRYTSR